MIFDLENISKPDFPINGSPEPVWSLVDGEILKKFYDTVGSGRADKEKRPYITDTREELVGKLLSVLDGFERIFCFAEQQTNDESGVLRNWLSSMKGTYKNLVRILEKEGLIRIETVGEKVDFNFHEVIETREKEGAFPGEIIEEIESGYTFREKVLRAAKVIVVPLGETNRNS